MFADVSEEHTTSIFRAEYAMQANKETASFKPNKQTSKQHDSTSQKTEHSL
jgi:hypothetical protein